MYIYIYIYIEREYGYYVIAYTEYYIYGTHSTLKTLCCALLISSALHNNLTTNPTAFQRRLRVHVCFRGANNPHFEGRGRHKNPPSSTNRWAENRMIGCRPNWANGLLPFAIPPQTRLEEHRALS